MYLKIRVLKYFLMVAREENITRAAELLHITKPTLSRQLQQLEKELRHEEETITGELVIGSGEARSLSVFTGGRNGAHWFAGILN